MTYTLDTCGYLARHSVLLELCNEEDQLFAIKSSPALTSDKASQSTSTAESCFISKSHISLVAVISTLLKNVDRNPAELALTNQLFDSELR